MDGVPDPVLPVWALQRGPPSVLLSQPLGPSQQGSAPAAAPPGVLYSPKCLRHSCSGAERGAELEDLQQGLGRKAAPESRDPEPRSLLPNFNNAMLTAFLLMCQ